MSDNDLVMRFLRDECCNHNHIKLSQILKFSDDEIEKYHDFIQWIFPTKRKSNYNFYAPTIDNNFKFIFQEDVIAKRNYCKTCNLYLNYIGINCTLGSLNYTENKFRIFQLPYHNYLRITRVLDSLQCVGNGICSQKLFKLIEEIIKVNGNISPDVLNSFKYWKNTQI